MITICISVDFHIGAWSVVATVDMPYVCCKYIHDDKAWISRVVVWLTKDPHLFEVTSHGFKREWIF